MLLLCSILLLASCKTDSKKTACAAVANKGNTLTIRLDGDANQINPFLSNAYGRYIASNVFQELGIIDPETLTLQPLLIKSIPVPRQEANGDWAYDFEINEAATWDNGSPITAKDVEFTYKIIANPLLPTKPFQGYFEELKALQVDANNPRKFTILESKYYILAVQALCQIPIYPAYAYDPDNLLGGIPLADFLDTKKITARSQTPNNPLKTFADAFLSARFATDPTAISGSGPYKVEQISADQGVTLVKKQNWWGDKVVSTNKYLAALPERLEFRRIKEDQVIENMLKTGELDLAPGVSPERFQQLRNDPLLKDCYTFSTHWAAQYTCLGLNTEQPKLADKTVRQALAYLVDYDYIINTAYNGMAQRTIGPISPNAPFYAKDLTPYTYDVEKAKALLAQAGWKDTNSNGTVDKVLNGKLTEFELQLIFPVSSSVVQQIGSSLESSLQKGGIKLLVEGIQLNELMERMKVGKFESAVFGRGMQPDWPDFYQSYHSKNLAPAGDNRSRFVNAEIDKFITEIRDTPDAAQRTARYVALQKVLHEEVPEVFLAIPQTRFITSNRFEPSLSANRPGYYAPYFKMRQ